MGHTYASVAQLKRFIKDSGDASSGGLGTTNDDFFLGFLEDASRAIDEYCARTGAGHPTSGFGPRTGTNRYDGVGIGSYAGTGASAFGGINGLQLNLDDDLLALSSVTVIQGLGGTPTAYVDETDFYKGPYDRAPYRQLVLNLLGQGSWYGVQRGVSVVGSWGYSDERVVAAATAAEAMDSSETGLDVSAATEFSPGMTLLEETEQLYITGIASSTLTVVRGANGTTPASHLTGLPLSIYRYPRQVVRTCLQLSLQRWKRRDSGSSGPLLMPGQGTVPDSSDIAILRNGVGDLSIKRLS